MNFMRILLGILAFHFLSSQELLAKVRILTFHYNRPDFVELQYKTFKKFFLDDYEVIVLNDAPDEDNEEAIQEVCEKYKWKCVRYEQSWHMTDPLNQWIKENVDTPHKNSIFGFPLEGGYPDVKAIAQQCSVRHSHVIQHALDFFGYDHDDIVVIMDADVFPVKPMSIRELLVDTPLIGIDNHRYYIEKLTNPQLIGIENHRHYLWVPFIAFDPQRLPNLKDLKFHVSIVDDVLCDTGSHSYHYLKNNPEVPCRLYPPCSDQDFTPWDPSTFLKFGFTNPEIARIPWPAFLEFYIDYHLVHFVGGSAYIHHPMKKQQALYDLLKYVLRD